jgi:hypothetical protein
MELYGNKAGKRRINVTFLGAYDLRASRTRKALEALPTAPLGYSSLIRQEATYFRLTNYFTKKLTPELL